MNDVTPRRRVSSGTMRRPPRRLRPEPAPWNDQQVRQLARELRVIRDDLPRLEQRFAAALRDADPAFQQSARNLVHYLALRRHDIRPLQERLAVLGLSSLGRTESHVMAAIDAVLEILERLSGGRAPVAPGRSRLSLAEGNALLAEHTEALLGPRPPARGVRIMVTMPSEAARDYDLVRQLLAHGMDCMRINCAHDDAAAWRRMVVHLQRARRELGRDCRVLMDLAGPKLRTGAIDPSSQTLRWRPRRDDRGAVTSPARIWLTALERPQAAPGACDGALHLPAAWLRRVRPRCRLTFTDLRGKTRSLRLAEAATGGRWATTTQTAYLQEGHPLRLVGAASTTGPRPPCTEAIARAASPDQHFLTLRPGDALLLTRAPLPGHPAILDRRGRVREPAAISCTLPQVFGDVRPRERIWFDDGKIGGVVEEVTADGLRVRITTARRDGEKLRADKGINLPDTRLRTPALTEKDLVDLDFVVRHADLVGLSFVRTPGDVRELQTQLDRRGATRLGIVLKIETRTGFDQLPTLLLAAMRSRRVGVMIARGDLAVECGYERLAEVQEEMLWFCEAAHVPVIWATQVLESLAKKGVPSRAEITDAAMSERAECVMLNKGAHLVEAMRVLQDILQRMEAHQSKKSARLRRLNLSAVAADA